MEGHLKIFVLKELHKKELSGYDIMKRVEELTGKKPSPGTMYPLLANLCKKQLIIVRQNKKRKLYSLSKKGKELFQEFIEQKKNFMKKNIALMRQVYSPKEMKGTEDMFKINKEKRQLFLLKTTIFEFLATPKKTAAQKKQFQAIIAETIKKIEEIKKG